MRALYSLVLILAMPMVFGYFALRGLRDPRYLRGWGQRLALGKGEPCDLVLHAASLGEVNAAAPLLRSLAGLQPPVRILVTTVTPTGAARAQELFGAQVQHAMAALDLPDAVRRFLGRHRPKLLVLVETEIWPNLLHAARQRDLPALVVNARLTESSLRGYRRWTRLLRPAFAGLNGVLAQTATDARRFERCGVPPERVEVSGNLKFDAPPSPQSLAAGRALRATWGEQRPVLVAGSTHEADESALLAAFRDLQSLHPDALLVLAPRHPERFARVADSVRSAGLPLARHSQGEAVSASVQCLLLDAMGELQAHYAAADLTFVGGTLAAIGGHNLLEPAALGKPVLFGPHLDNVRDIADSLLQGGAALMVADAAELTQAVDRLLNSPESCRQMGQAGAELVKSGQGALARTLEVIRDRLETSPGSS
jgi:3-deoxy-D-manno-octulosonic-acid transferase